MEEQHSRTISFGASDGDPKSVQVEVAQLQDELEDVQHRASDYAKQIEALNDRSVELIRQVEDLTGCSRPSSCSETVPKSPKATPSSSQIGCLKGLRPDKFDGSEDAIIWLKTLEHFAKLANWSEKDKVRSFPLFLRGNAQIWYQGLDHTNHMDWATLKTHFFKRFNDPAMKWVRNREFHASKLMPGESIESYGDTLRKKAAELELPQDVIMSAYIGGLPSEIQRIVWQAMPTTLADAEKTARNACKMLKIETPTVAAVSSQRSLDDIQSCLKDIVRRLEKLETQPEVQSTRRIQCYECGGYGHIARECRGQYRSGQRQQRPKQYGANGASK